MVRIFWCCHCVRDRGRPALDPWQASIVKGALYDTGHNEPGV